MPASVSSEIGFRVIPDFVFPQPALRLSGRWRVNSNLGCQAVLKEASVPLIAWITGGLPMLPVPAPPRSFAASSGFGSAWVCQPVPERPCWLCVLCGHRLDRFRPLLYGHQGLFAHDAVKGVGIPSISSASLQKVGFPAVSEQGMVMVFEVSLFRAASSV